MSEAVGQAAGSPTALGLQLRNARKNAGLTLRELAGRLGVSPSLLSQIENGKSQPSVATLYALAHTLQLSLDHLFENHPADLTTTADARGVPGKQVEHGSPPQEWHDDRSADRLSVTTPTNRTRLVTDTGVIWERLATNTAQQLDFLQVTYPPGTSSTADDRMLQHDGFEYGYVLEGEFEITLGFDVFSIRAGEAMGLNSSLPHQLRNRGDVPARGIWFVHHRHG